MVVDQVVRFGSSDQSFVWLRVSYVSYDYEAGQLWLEDLVSRYRFALNQLASRALPMHRNARRIKSGSLRFLYENREQMVTIEMIRAKLVHDIGVVELVGASRQVMAEHCDDRKLDVRAAPRGSGKALRIMSGEVTDDALRFWGEDLREQELVRGPDNVVRLCL